jgi:toluene monooxygenase system protein E
LYGRKGGFAIDVPLSDWYARHQRGGRLACEDWDRFADPRETTYAKYVGFARAQESFAEGVLRAIERGRYDVLLPAEWVGALERLLPVARFPAHALQMLAAYIGQMAPGARIVVACAMQAADDLRRVHRLTERTVQLRRTFGGFGENARAGWEKDPAWQPMREVCERALVAWDWGEAFVACNVCIAPLFDELLLSGVPAIARGRGDPMLTSFFASFDEDSAWHRDWTRALVGLVAAASEENRRAIHGWIEVWLPRARAAVLALDALVAPDAAAGAAILTHDAWIASLGLAPS